MRKNILSLSIAAMIGGLVLAGGASAGVVSTNSTATSLAVTPDGIGHILMVPYFSTQGGNSTLFNLVNTDATRGKLVKVRFRGATNSDDVLDFLVALSPGDEWTANISSDGTGVSSLVTYDKTCTVPRSVQETGPNDRKQLFGTSRTNSKLSAAARAAETREGYMEILNVADIAGDSALYTATKHVGGVAPCYSTAASAAALDRLQTVAFNITDETMAAQAGLTYPTTGLMANWYLFNVATATSWSGAADAIEARDATGAAAKGNIVAFPQANGPAGAAMAGFSADPLFGANGGLTLNFLDLPDLSTPYADADLDASSNALVTDARWVYAANTATPPAAGAQQNFARSVVQAAELTKSLARSKVVNEYVTNDGIGASTDWVISMPTRRYSVALNYSAPANDATEGRRFTDFSAWSVSTVSGSAAPAALPAFFTEGNTVVQTSNNGGAVICVTGIDQVFWDREETTYTSGGVVSPPQETATINFCGEVSVWSINATNASTASALSAAITRQDYTNAIGSADGWASFSTPSATAGYGLPVLGSAFMQFVGNPVTTSGAVGYFGLAFPHRYGR